MDAAVSQPKSPLYRTKNVTFPKRLHGDSSRCHHFVTALQSDLHHVIKRTGPKQLHINSSCRYQSENATRVQHVSHTLAYLHRNVQVYRSVSQVMAIGHVTSPWILGCVLSEEVRQEVMSRTTMTIHVLHEARCWCLDSLVPRRSRGRGSSSPLLSTPGYKPSTSLL